MDNVAIYVFEIQEVVSVEVSSGDIWPEIDSANARITATETVANAAASKNTTQDSRLTATETVANAAEAKNTTQDSRLTATETVANNAASAVSAKADSTTVNSALSNKADLVGGKIPGEQLPSSIDEVREYANLAAFPVSGDLSVIYIAIDTSISYRWGGTVYVALNSGIALGETSATAYRGDRGKTAYDHSQVTHDKTLVGLGNVDNTADASKPVSTAQQTALNLKLNTSSFTAAGLNLGNVENKSSATIRGEIVEADIPVAIARVTAIPDELSDLTDDATHRTVTDTEKATWNAIATIVSGTESPSGVWAPTNDIGNVTLSANLVITSVSPVPEAGPSAKYFTHGAYTLTVSLPGTISRSDFKSDNGIYKVSVTNKGTFGSPVYDVRDLNQGITEAEALVLIADNGTGLSIEDQTRLDLIFGLYVPDAPTIATSISGDDISVDITAPVDNGGFTITGYRIEMRTDAGAYSTLNESTTNDPYIIVNPGAGVHDVRAYAINVMGESVASNVDTETIVISIIELSDNFNDNSIDTNIWTVLSDANITVTEQNQRIQILNGGSSGGIRRGLWGNAKTIQNNLIIIQTKLTQPNSTTFTSRFGLCRDSTELAYRAYLQGSAITGGTLRWVGIQNNVATTTETGISATSGLDVRIKYVPTTDVATAEYWNGSAWVSMGNHTVDLTGTTYAMLLASSSAAGANTVIFDDFFMTFANYTTQYPV